MDIRPPTMPGRSSSCGPRASCCTKLCSACGSKTQAAQRCEWPVAANVECIWCLTAAVADWWAAKLSKISGKDWQGSHLQQAQHTNWTELLYCCQIGPRVLPRMHAQLHQRIPQACRRNSSSGSNIPCSPMRCLPNQSHTKHWQKISL